MRFVFVEMRSEAGRRGFILWGVGEGSGRVVGGMGDVFGGTLTVVNRGRMGT